MPHTKDDHAPMMLDPQTCRDLEIFECSKDGRTVFDLLAQTRSTGGAKVLRKRMAHPYVDGAQIRSVQRSIRFLQEHPLVFTRLPTDVVLMAVEDYLRSGLPVVTSDNWLELVTGALETRFGDGRAYGQILRGVVRTCRFLGALRGALAGTDGVAPGDEIGGLLAGLTDLLHAIDRYRVPGEERWDLGAWEVLRLDRVFRARHEVTLRRLIEITYQLDALGGMAQAMLDHDLVFPEIVDGPVSVCGEGIRHLLVGQPVTNPVHVNSSRPIVFLTGPNMAGKTTYLKAVGVCVYLSQIGMGVPAKHLRIAPCDGLFTSLSITDDLRAGVSYFRAEALRMRSIAEAVTQGLRVIALIDEPFKGTNVRDALDASRAILTEFAAFDWSLLFVASHLIELAPDLQLLGKVDFRHFEAGEAGGRLQFDYRLKEGVSAQRLGMRVLAEEGLFELFRSRRAKDLPTGHHPGSQITRP